MAEIKWRPEGWDEHIKTVFASPAAFQLESNFKSGGAKMLELIHDGIMREGYPFVESFVIELIKAKSCET